MILGIDPGLSQTGLALLSQTEHPKIIFSGWIRIRKSDLGSKLHQLGTELQEFLDQYDQIHACAIEKVFFDPSKPGAIPLAHARGVLLYILSKNAIPIYEYAPTAIKKAITTVGNATKESVRISLQRVLQINSLVSTTNRIGVSSASLKKVPDDVYDALAIAWTHKIVGTF